MKKQNQKGITLIALVITIIVMVILVEVTISVALNGGLIKQSVNSKEAQTVAEEKEFIGLAYSDYKMAKINNEEYTMQNALDNEQAEAIVEGDEILGWTITFKKNNHKYTLYSNGIVNSGITEKWDGKSKEKPIIAEDNSWHINKCAHMKYFADFINGELTAEEKGDLTITKDTVIYLESNLDLGARTNDKGEKIIGEEWTPIGISKAKTFIGTFEGNNHYITGVYVNRDGNFGGVFGNSNSIKNLTIVNSYIKSANAVGGIVGVLRSGVLSNCHNINTTITAGGVQNANGSVGSNAGGVVGQLSANSIENCSNTGSVTGVVAVGGVVGLSSKQTSIKDCRNMGTVFGTSYHVGGVVGSGLSGVTIENCINKGNITCKGENVGGIAGKTSSYSKVDNCINSGNVTGNPYGVGGCIGILFGNINQCCNIGKVTGEKGAGAGIGGVVGVISTYNGETTNITTCYNIGEVYSKTKGTGGIVGWTTGEKPKGTIQNNYNSGKITGTTLVGGLIGMNSNEFIVKNCYSKGEVVGNSEIGGIIGEQAKGNETNLERLYYIENLNINGIGNIAESKKTEEVAENLNSFEEFLNWIQQKNKL